MKYVMTRLNRDESAVAAFGLEMEVVLSAVMFWTVVKVNV